MSFVSFHLEKAHKLLLTIFFFFFKAHPMQSRSRSIQNRSLTSGLFAGQLDSQLAESPDKVVVCQLIDGARKVVSLSLRLFLDSPLSHSSRPIRLLLLGLSLHPFTSLFSLRSSFYSHPTTTAHFVVFLLFACLFVCFCVGERPKRLTEMSQAKCAAVAQTRRASVGHCPRTCRRSWLAEDGSRWSGSTT